MKQAVLSGGGIRLFLRLLYSPDVEVQVINIFLLLKLSKELLLLFFSQFFFFFTEIFLSCFVKLGC